MTGVGFILLEGLDALKKNKKNRTPVKICTHSYIRDEVNIDNILFRLTLVKKKKTTQLEESPPNYLG